MNKERIAAELPDGAMREWMQRHADTDLWERVGRTIAVDCAVRLLGPTEWRGEAGWNPVLFELCRTDPSPTVRHVAAALGCDPRGRRWTIERVAKAVTKYLELYSGRYAVTRRLQEQFAPQTRAALAA